MPTQQQNPITIRLPRELSDRIAKLAASEFESRSNVLRRIIRAGLKTLDIAPRSSDRKVG